MLTVRQQFMAPAVVAHIGAQQSALWEPKFEESTAALPAATVTDEQQLQRIRGQVETAKQATVESEKRLEEAKAQLEAARNESAEKQAEIDARSAELKAKQARVAAMQDEIAKLKDAALKVREEKAKARNEHLVGLSEIEKHLRSVQQTGPALLGKYNDLISSIERDPTAAGAHPLQHAAPQRGCARGRTVRRGGGAQPGTSACRPWRRRLTRRRRS